MLDDSDATAENDSYEELRADLAEMMRFVSVVFARATPGSYISLRAFYSDSKPLFTTFPTVRVREGDAWLRELADQACRYADMAAKPPRSLPCTFCPPPCTFSTAKKARKGDVADGLALIVDCDVHPESSLVKLRATFGEPTLIIASGGQWNDPDSGRTEDKLHCYYVLAEIARAPEEHKRLESLRRKACTLIGSDPSGTPINHPMRWPGSWHTKNSPRMCRIVGGDVTRFLSLIELERLVSPMSQDDTASLWENLARGENLHDSAVKLAFRLIKKGTPRAAALQQLQDAMLALPEHKRDERWRQRYEDLSRCVESAASKLNGDVDPTHTVWPPGFHMEPSGLYYIKPTARGDATHTWISAPFDLLATATDEKGGDHSSVIIFTDKHFRTVEHVVHAADRHANFAALKARLAAAGLRFATKSADLLLDAILMAQSPRREITVSKPGWTHDGKAFVLPDGAVVEQSDNRKHKRMRFSSDHLEHNGRGERSGALEEAKRLTALASGNCRAVFALSAAFAPALLRDLRAETRILHFYGPSSRGKSTLLLAAASVWGNPTPLPSWRATTNGLEARAAAANDGLMILDEAHQCEPDTLALAVYTYANGAGAGRMNQDGKTARKVNYWRGLALSSGETRISSRIRLNKKSGGKVTAGQEQRALDIPAVSETERGAFDNLHHFEPKEGADDKELRRAAGRFSDELQEIAKANYGHLGPAFMEGFIARHAMSLARVKELMDESASKAPSFSDGQVHRAAKTFAMIGAAGELANELLELGWRAGEAQAAAEQMFFLWRASTGGDRPREEGEVLRRVRDFIEQNSARFIDVLKRSDDDNEDRMSVPFEAAGWFRWREDGEHLFVFNSATFAEIFSDIGASQAAKNLRECHALIVSKDRGCQFEFTRANEKHRGYAVRPEGLNRAIDRHERGQDPTSLSH
jgi:putative DNA primase/helicase